MSFIRVKDVTGAWLAPCHPARARELVQLRRAVIRMDDQKCAYLQLVVGRVKGS